jgi:hypothetical protein
MTRAPLTALPDADHDATPPAARNPIAGFQVRRGRVDAQAMSLRLPTAIRALSVATLSALTVLPASAPAQSPQPVAGSWSGAVGTGKTRGHVSLNVLDNGKVAASVWFSTRPCTPRTSVRGPFAGGAAFVTRITDGTFRKTSRGSYLADGGPKPARPAQLKVTVNARVTGRFTSATTVTGTYRADVKLRYANGLRGTCATGTQTWTAKLDEQEEDPVAPDETSDEAPDEDMSDWEPITR